MVACAASGPSRLNCRIHEDQTTPGSRRVTMRFPHDGPLAAQYRPGHADRGWGGVAKTLCLRHHVRISTVVSAQTPSCSANAAGSVTGAWQTYPSQTYAVGWPPRIGRSARSAIADADVASGAPA